MISGIFWKNDFVILHLLVDSTHDFICLKSLFVSEKCCTFAVDYRVGRKERGERCKVITSD